MTDPSSFRTQVFHTVSRNRSESLGSAEVAATEIYKQGRIRNRLDRRLKIRLKSAIKNKGNARKLVFN
jgi:hypothetical protein